MTRDEQAGGTMLSYRSTFTVDKQVGEVVPAVQAIMVRWAERKHHKVLGARGLDDLVPGTWLKPSDGLEFILSDTTESSGDRLFAFVCIEHDGPQTWTSQVMVAGGPRGEDRALVSVVIDAPMSPDDPMRPKNAAVPRFVRTLLGTFECDDNGIRLSDAPQVLGPENVPSLVKELEDDDHHGLVLVAGTVESLPLENWTGFIQTITKGTVGQAATYVLNAEATQAFNDRVSTRHAVGGGSLRTFVPGARFSDPDDGVRHRFLTAQTLADDALRRRAGTVLERRSRAVTNSRPLDRRVRRSLVLVARHLDEIVFNQDAIVESAPVTPLEGMARVESIDSAGLQATVDRLQGALSDRETSLARARTDLVQARNRTSLFERRVVAAEAETDELRSTLEDRTQERDELRLDYAMALEAKNYAIDLAQHREREINRLRRLLEKEGRSADAWAGEPEPAEFPLPADWPALAEWEKDGRLSRRFPFLEFTCDWECAIDLDDKNELSWIATTGDILGALNDYARARAQESLKVRNLHEYLIEPPEGYRTVSRGKYKPKESDTVSNREKYRNERLFPVPEPVPGRDSSGRIFMEKHFVIAQSGMVSPRLYLYDATHVDGYGKVVVGYIGRHLTNDQTN